MTENELKNLLAAVTPPDEAARAAAHAHWAALAKPLGGLVNWLVQRTRLEL